MTGLITAVNPFLEEEARGYQALMDILPGRIRDTVSDLEGVSEISLLLGRPLVVSYGGWGNVVEYADILVEEDEIAYVVSSLSGIKEDGRAGLDGTAHRISVIYSRTREIIGLTIRIARFLQVAPKELEELVLTSRGSVLIVGAPESGKTTLLRNIVALLSREIGPHLSVIDTSNEIGGLGRVPHPALGTARWHQVPDPKEQAQIIRRVIANHAPLVLVLDEVGYNDDVEEVESAARRGIQVISSVHGGDLLDVLENPRYGPLLGSPDLRARRRLARPAFAAAVEVRGKGKLFLVPDLPQAVDRLLEGLPPEGIKLGKWSPGEEAYPRLPPAGKREEDLLEGAALLAQAYRQRDPLLGKAASELGLERREFLDLMVSVLAGERPPILWDLLRAYQKWREA
ncbi:hypothetical protein HRbin39_00023 [bacterium HR39]|nr:hypothetical protein HRbin39_00023 [bacterium HR39]